MSKSDEKSKDIIITYSFSDYEKLKNYHEKKGIAFGLFAASIFTLIFMNIGEIDDYYFCTINLLVYLLFVLALSYKFYSHYLSKKLTFAEVEEI